MNITKLFTDKEPVAGLDINDAKAKLILLSEEGGHGVETIKYSEEPFAPGAIRGGEIGDEKSFIRTITALLDKTPVKYAVISIPADHVYSKVFSFPLGVTDDKLESSMKLAANFQLPKKIDEIYLDWEKIKNPEKNEALLSLIKKPIVDKLILSLGKAGLKTVAVEFHPLSLARLIRQKDREQSLVIEKGDKASSFYIIKDNGLRFLRTSADAPKSLVSEEAKKVIDFYESENENISRIVLIGKFSQSEIKSLPLKPSAIELLDRYGSLKSEEVDDYIFALGSAYRGLMPRSQDDFTSLMEMGTEEAFKRQRFIAFVDFLVKSTITASIFFIIAFASAWILMLKIQQNFNEQIENYGSLPASRDSLALEEKALAFNELVSQTSGLIKTEPRWSLLLDELKSLIIPGININTLSISSVDRPVAISGLAENRNQLNLFKKNLDASPFLSKINLPLDNLEKKEKIPFTMNFTIKNPESLFFSK